MAANKKPPGERILVEFVGELAGRPGLEMETLERLAGAAPLHSSWSDMYSRLPKFPDRLTFNSPNMQALASGCGLWHPETREVALASWARAAALEESVGFELVEPGSRIYRSWSLLGRLSAYRWALANRAAAGALLTYLSRWLALYWTVEALASVELPDGIRSLRCGARSQGAFERIIPDYALTRALGGSWEWRLKPHPLPDQSWTKGNDVMAFDAFGAEIDFSSLAVRDAWQASEGGSRRLIVQSLVSAAPKWPTIAATIYHRTTRGLAVWCERSDVNGNTPGIACMIYHSASPGVDARYEAAPTPSRAHVRQNRVPQKIRRDGDVLRFWQSAPGTPEDLTLALPGGELFYEVRHGAGGLEMVG